MLLFLMDVDFECDWILIQIFYVHRFVIPIPITSANTTANKDFLHTKNRSQKKKKLAKQYKTFILQQQFKNNLITNKNTNILTSANVCQIWISQFVTLLLHK